MFSMARGKIERTGVILFVLFGLFAVSVLGLLTSDTAHAQIRPSGECRAAIVIDRSGSVKDHLPAMKANVRLLFGPMGINHERIKLGFWTFANMKGSENYNVPFHDYVQSDGMGAGFSSFSTQFESIDVSPTGTNSEHALSYHMGVQNKFMADVANSADLIVLITDAEDNSFLNVARAQVAANKYRAQGVQIIGGLVKNKTSVYMNRIINDSYTNNANIFQVNENYSNLSDVLSDWVKTKCIPKIMCEWNSAIYADDSRCLPPEAFPYSLVPSVSRQSSPVISGSDSARFEYKIENSSTENPSRPTNWSIKRLVVDKSGSVDALKFESPAYRDGLSCAQLIALAGAGTRCEDAAGSSRPFGPQSTSLGAAEIGNAAGVTVQNDWVAGTKVCYVLTIEQPTQLSEPRNRYSSAECVVVGKQPTFQVHGGDMVVGRQFSTGGPSVGDVRGAVTTKTGLQNGETKTFGSWVEYGIFAPGEVRGVASASGFAGGHQGEVADSPNLWSALTFANTDGVYGKYANSMGRVTNMADFFTTGQAPLETVSTGVKDFNGEEVRSGLYKSSGDLAIEASTLRPGKRVVVWAPDGTVTIRGNINYTDDRLTSINDIPQLVLIAKKIIINSNVTNVDAWLLAQDGEGAGGVIETCDFAGNLTSEVCNAPLRVNGPITAKDLLLRRTGGSDNGEPAEIFNLRADAYLWGYKEGRSALRAETTHTIELPPHF